MMKDIPISKHPLTHIPELKVDPGLLDMRFARECSILKCSAACCQGGVWIDEKERENIVRHVELIRQYMDPDMVKNPAEWFDNIFSIDEDFESGRSVGTAVTGNGCVFLNGAGLCVLQKVESSERKSTLKLKPFYCKAYPLTIENGKVTFDNYMEYDQPQCCSATQGGEFTVFDIFEEELQLILGKDGLVELRDIAKTISHYASTMLKESI